MQLLSWGEALFILIILESIIHILSSEKILATVSNIDVLLNGVLFMEVLEPHSISYTYKIRAAKNFGTKFARTYRGIELAVSEPYLACSTLQNANYLSGRVVLVQRGECSFVTKALQAEEAGAAAVVIADSDLSNDHMLIDMIDDNTDRQVHIPAVFLLGKDGYMIKSALEQLGFRYAVINIPINVTGAAIYQINQPPWTLW